MGILLCAQGHNLCFGFLVAFTAQQFHFASLFTPVMSLIETGKAAAVPAMTHVHPGKLSSTFWYSGQENAESESSRSSRDEVQDV